MDFLHNHFPQKTSREFPLKDDEVWPEEVAHLFTLHQEDEGVKEEGKDGGNEERKEEREEERRKEKKGDRTDGDEAQKDNEGNESNEGDFGGRRRRRSIRGEEWTGVWPQR